MTDKPISAWEACRTLDTEAIAQASAQRAFECFSFSTLQGPENLRARLSMAAREAAHLGALAGYRHASTIEARSGKTRSGLIEDESVTPSGGTQETLINQDFANE